MSTSRAASSTPSTATLRPRAARLISGLTDPDSGNDSSLVPQSYSKSSSRSPPSSRRLSPLRTVTTRESSAQSCITSHQRTRTEASPSNPLVNLWGTSWSAIQEIANDFLGEQEPAPLRQRQKGNVGNGKLHFKTQVPSWGPSAPVDVPSATSIAIGSREERDALVRAQKRKDLLSGAAASYTDASGKYKRRLSDEAVSTSAPPRTDDDRDALVYLHHVRPEDTLAGITIRYSCQANVLRKANRMWTNDKVQIRKVLLLPVDACGVKGKPVSDHEADLMSTNDLDDLPTPVPNGTLTHSRAQSTASNLSERPPPSVSAASTTDTEPGWTHDSWVLLPNSTTPTEIARLPRRSLGYFPPARRKSQSYSDLDTPKTSLDLTRQSTHQSANHDHSPSSLRIDPPQRPRRLRRLSSASNGYFPSYLIGPGGVGTMSKDVHAPGPAQDGLNKLFAARLPNVAPPPNQQALYMPDVPLYSDNAGSGTSTPFFGPSASGRVTPSLNQAQGLVKLENVGAAVEGWIRKMAVRAQTLAPTGDADGLGGSSAQHAGHARGARAGHGPAGASGIGDLIEMADSFEIGGHDEDSGDDGPSTGGGLLAQHPGPRGRAAEKITGASSTGMGTVAGGAARSRGKSGKKD